MEEVSLGVSPLALSPESYKSAIRDRKPQMNSCSRSRPVGAYAGMTGTSNSISFVPRMSRWPYTPRDLASTAQGGIRKFQARALGSADDPENPLFAVKGTECKMGAPMADV